MNDDVALDATPGTGPPDKLKQIEDFIDHVLAAYVGRKLS